MAFNFDQIFKESLSVGIAAAKPGGNEAQDWIKKSAKANEDALRSIIQEFSNRNISKETAQYLLGQNERALRAEAAALKVIAHATAQAAVNGFFEALRTGILAALKVAL
ncbi:hypothetical protein [Achromobacter kerstersii]|jgi:hypothetical protein|uniref:hypothetical protein n=1 Tax=Achromobacter kerstersii TaxID=1353890 RepID=UPI00320AAC69